MRLSRGDGSRFGILTCFIGVLFLMTATAYKAEDSTPTDAPSSTPTDSIPPINNEPTLTPSPTASFVASPYTATSFDPSRSDTPFASDTRAPTETATTSWEVRFSEIAWAGTSAYATDEWMELWNPGGGAVSLSGWTLTDGGDIHIALTGTIVAGGYYLLERTDDTTVADVPADQIYSGALGNGGENLILMDPAGRVLDSIMAATGWPAGNSAIFNSMERTGLGNTWCTNDGVHRNGLDALGQPIHGTPRQAFSGYCAPASTLSPTRTSTATKTPTLTKTDSPTVTATTQWEATETTAPSPTIAVTPTPFFNPAGTILISEIGWAGTAFSADDEWIELHNPGMNLVDLTGWSLDDANHIHINLHGTLPSGGYFLLERTSDDSIADIPADAIYVGALSNTGAILRLYDPAGALVDVAGEIPWTAGTSTPVQASMERTDTGTWCTNDGIHRNGLDSGGSPIDGTPRQPFSGYCAPLTPTHTATRSATPTVTRTATWIMSPYPIGSIFINELGWGGTAASSSDEWMELWNPGGTDIALNGWRITDGDKFSVSLMGTIPSHGYFLLERGDDSTIRDIPADQIYEGILENTGAALRLIAPSGTIIDEANAAGHAWPAGSGSPEYQSMERSSMSPESWRSNNNLQHNGEDADGFPVRGTPRMPNSALFPTPMPTALPRGLMINEILPKPGTDWNGDGKTDLGDEFIEVFNEGDTAADLSGWFLDDLPHGGSHPYRIPDGTIIAPKGLLVFFHKQTKISLGDSGDGAWLLAPDGSPIDGINYSYTRWRDSAWGRYPEGIGEIRLGFPPTPGQPNRLPPDLENPKPTAKPKTPLGWRDLDCARQNPSPAMIGDGALLISSESAWKMAERLGWVFSSGKQCYGWAGRMSPATIGRASWQSGFEIGNGYWWAMIMMR
jgi:hypothetical protein